MKIGFIGVGIMGRPMAGHLQAAGHTLLLAKHRTPLPAELLAGGAVVHETYQAVAADAEVVILMLPQTKQVQSVLFDPAGVAEGLRPGTAVVDMSSIDPIATKDFAKRIEARGCVYADAPVSGGELGAKNAALSIMVGASDAVFERLRPLFETMGKTIKRVGPVGDGQTAKVANQIVVALTIQAVAEALVFAAKAGADPAKVREALLGGFASSKVLEVHGERMIERKFNPGFRIALHQKDLGLALDGARSLGLSLPATAIVQQMFSACAAQGFADADHSALITAVESMANFCLPKTA